MFSHASSKGISCLSTFLCTRLQLEIVFWDDQVNDALDAADWAVALYKFEFFWCIDFNLDLLAVTARLVYNHFFPVERMESALKQWQGESVSQNIFLFISPIALLIFYSPLEINLSALRNSLDAQSQEILSLQTSSLSSRKQLAEQTKGDLLSSLTLRFRLKIHSPSKKKSLKGYPTSKSWLTSRTS